MHLFLTVVFVLQKSHAYNSSFVLVFQKANYYSASNAGGVPLQD
jgi:hypothetical protein